MSMNRYLHKLEVLVDKAILPAIAVLLAILITEIFYKETAHHYETLIHYADIGIVSLFVLDLAFKYNRVRKIPKFIRLYWLDILAVFPFILLFRAFEGLYGLISASEAIGQFGTAQQVLHEGLEIEKEAVKISESISKVTKEGEIAAKEATRVIKEIEQTGKIARTTRFARFARFIRPLQRMPRLFKAVSFFEKPSGRHYSHEFIKYKTH